ncbi:hypothetical protein [Acidovorax sp. JMULE5]|uniref:hypothetical protein n=1 Tax=Acidovorax sp. JMULE5 TaxID=2518343 RepID=UPI0015A2BC1B|nr:hypothetical protein [Acidovorax sp. JMULE5]
MKPPKFASTGACACAALAGPSRMRSQCCVARARMAACMACAQTPTLTLSEET